MKKLVVGGNFGENTHKSGVAKKIADSLYADIFNGGPLKFLEFSKNAISDYDLIVWMPNIDNEVKKDYPKKKIGSVLICSKVIHNDRTEGDAVSRIFKMNANAVIAIIPTDNYYEFKLIDALGNLWIKTNNISELSDAIERFSDWTKKSIRKNTEKLNFEKLNFDNINFDVEKHFCEIIQKVSQKVEKERGGRYFGNASTRCSFMFPSKKDNNLGIFVSGRNLPKDFIKPEDFIYVKDLDDKLGFIGERKPSVDSPVQMELYKKFPKIEYMIHGHAYIKDAKMTKHYYPCGDLREVNSVMEILESFSESQISVFHINLKNHGFIIFAENLKDLELFVNDTIFEYRQLEEEIN